VRIHRQYNHRGSSVGCGLFSMYLVDSLTRCAYLINVMLEYSSPYHSHSARYETGCDFLQCTKVKASTSDSRIELQNKTMAWSRRKAQRGLFTHNKIANGNKYQQCERVQIRYYIIWHTMRGKIRSLRCHIGCFRSMVARK